METTHRNHCKEHISTIDLSKYVGIVIVSGDGLVHEFVNSSIVGKLPLAHVPGGSGNGFSQNQAFVAGEECNTESIMFLAVKGKTKDFNIMVMMLLFRR